jgi:inosose dehydratase
MERTDDRQRPDRDVCVPAGEGQPPLIHRRAFLAAAGAATLAGPAARVLAADRPLDVATNTYPWGTFAGRDGRAFDPRSDETLAAIAAAGLTGYEPAIAEVGEIDGLGPRLRAHGLHMASLYVNSSLHDEASAAASIEHVLGIARRAAPLGTRIVVTNPTPIRWGGPENKTDAQLRSQAAALDRLGRELRALGLTLAFHNHDIELRLGAREFHHMLTATDPAHVKFCLDVHWVFRGCGDSQVALFDVLEHYGDRVVELHLRQSNAGVWAEAFAADGDIAYARLADWLRRRKIQPQLTLEQAVEAKSPKTLDAVTAHRRGLEAVRAVFARRASRVVQALETR